MPDQERELSPEQEAEVGRLLADARATEPLPAEVAARLDRVLIGLGEERGGTPVPAGNVIALASRRRRASILLVAAAAVVAIGVGLGQIVNETSTSGDDAGASSSADGNFAESPADRGAADEDSAGGGRGGEPEAVPSELESGQAEPGSSAPPVVPPTIGRVRQDSFTADANQLRRAIPDDALDGEFVELAADQLPRGYVLTDRPFDCAPAAWGAGVLVPVFYDGMPAVLAYRPVAGESQVVDILQCGTGDQLGSTTLRAG